MMSIRNHFTDEDKRMLSTTGKIGLLATITPEGLPHITFINTMQPKDERRLMWGQFSVGRSKKHVKTNPRTGFLCLSLNKKLWRGKATWMEEKKEGEDYELYNNYPMFRYNTYFGINTVHYMRLEEVEGAYSLPLASIIPATIATLFAKRFAKTKSSERILNPWSYDLFKRNDTLKFLAAIDEDGFAKITPLLQCRAADTNRLVFSPLAYPHELQKLRAGQTVAIFGITMQMESVLVRGSFSGFSRTAGLKLGALDINFVYNSLPPNHGRIYPPKPLEAVTNFDC